MASFEMTCAVLCARPAERKLAPTEEADRSSWRPNTSPVLVLGRVSVNSATRAANTMVRRFRSLAGTVVHLGAIRNSQFEIPQARWWGWQGEERWGQRTRS